MHGEQAHRVMRLRLEVRAYSYGKLSAIAKLGRPWPQRIRSSKTIRIACGIISLLGLCCNAVWKALKNAPRIATYSICTSPHYLVFWIYYDLPRLVTIFADKKYHNHDLEAWLVEHCADWNIKVKPRPEGTKGFTSLEKRWVIERTNDWHGRYHRNSQGYKRSVASSTAMIQIMKRQRGQRQPRFHRARGDKDLLPSMASGEKRAHPPAAPSRFLGVNTFAKAAIMMVIASGDAAQNGFSP
jgi:hypothetical protein